MRVLKFGGTSIGDSNSIKTVAGIVRQRAHPSPVLVFSAIGHTTDRLAELGNKAAAGLFDESLEVAREIRQQHLALIHELLPAGEARWRMETLCEQLFVSLKDAARSLSVLTDFSPAVQDRILAKGELISTQLLCEVLRDEGLPAEWVDARELLVTDGSHTCAEPLLALTTERCRCALVPLLEKGRIPVTQGYIGRSESGQATTLGRGGSDFTASILGAALGAEEIEIWTDVDGIMTADPSVVPEARNIPSMGFQEAAELAFFGARVLHPKTLLPAVEKGIPVRVLNARKPGGEGTVILPRSQPSGRPVKSIAYKEGMTLLNLVSTKMFKAHGFLEGVFRLLDQRRIAPDVVATSEVSVALALHEPQDLESLAESLRSFGSVTVRKGQAVVCVVGEGLHETPGIVGQVFQDLKDVRVSLVSQGGSEINLGFVVDEADLARVVRRLHRRFFEQRGAGALWEPALCDPPALM